MSENNRYFYDCGKNDKDLCDCHDRDCEKKEDKCFSHDRDCVKKEDKCYSHDRDCVKKEDKCCGHNKHYPEKKHVECCCKLGIKRATEILGNDKIKEYINFNAAAFITDFFLVGTELTTLGANDNLGALTGSLDKLNPCECDLLQISGPLAYPVAFDAALLEELAGLLGLTTPILATLTTANTTIEGVIAGLGALVTALNALTAGLGTALSPTLTGIANALNGTIDATTDIVNDLFIGLVNILTSLFASEAAVGANADLASLCAIKAIVLEVLGATPELQIANYDLIKEAIRCLRCTKCDIEDCEPKCDDCCCSNGVVNEVVAGNLTGRVSLTAGSLVLENVEVIGCVGNALILGAPYIPAVVTPPTPAVNAKIYIVCAEAVQFIG